MKWIHLIFLVISKNKAELVILNKRVFNKSFTTNVYRFYQQSKQAQNQNHVTNYEPVSNHDSWITNCWQPDTDFDQMETPEYRELKYMFQIRLFTGLSRTCRVKRNQILFFCTYQKCFEIFLILNFEFEFFGGT